jgi:hypothetical protein
MRKVRVITVEGSYIRGLYSLRPGEWDFKIFKKSIIPICKSKRSSIWKSHCSHVSFMH